MTLKLIGAVPSKKNNYRRSAHGGMFIPNKEAAEIASLMFQARAQWGDREPVSPDATFAFRFYRKTRRADRDNAYTCLLDVLQKAGVIRNDNLKHCNGEHIICPAVVNSSLSVERVEIEVSE
jgi:Holliday junction resolvase RusA-like endonuclease